MQTSVLSDAKTSDFLKFMMCPHEKGGRGQFFAILCGRPFWTAPNSQTV